MSRVTLRPCPPRIARRTSYNPPARRLGPASSLTLFLTLALAAPAAAQPSSHEFAAPLKFQTISTDILPQSNVATIAQDEFGFIWMGTQEGLIRYDGYESSTFTHDPDDAGSLSDDHITTLLVDQAGYLWIGTSKGLNGYDPKTGTIKRFGDELNLASDEPVIDLYADVNNQLWVSQTAGGVVMVGADRSTTREFDALEEVVTAIHGDAKGTVWLGTSSGSVLSLDPKSEKSSEFASSPTEDSEVNDIVVASDGYVWVATQTAGVTRIDPEKELLQSYRANPRDATTLSFDAVSALLEDREGSLWVATESGFNRLDRESGTFTRYLASAFDSNSVADEHQTALFEDRDGVIWIGTWSKGISFVDSLAKRFHHYRFPTTVLSFAETRGGLWIGTYKGGLLRLDQKSRRAEVYTDLGSPGDIDYINLSDYWLMDVYEDKDKKVWIATYGGGLVSLDPSRGVYSTYSTDNSDLQSDNVFSIEPDGKGGLWLGTWGGGLHHYDPERDLFDAIPAESTTGIESDEIYSLRASKASPGTLWIATAGGLSRLDTDSRTAKHFGHVESDPNTLSNNQVLWIHETSTGELWLGTYGGGLNRLDPTTGATKSFGRDHGLENQTIYSVLPDAKGDLWLSTNGGGLIRFSPATENATHFRVGDGVQDDEFAQGSALRLSDGTLIFGGLRGFNLFRGEEIEQDTTVPIPTFTKFLVGGNEVKLDNPIWARPKISLGYEDDVFSIEFSTLRFSDPSRSRFSFKLVGFDDDWREVGASRRFATYTNLDGGDYKLLVRAMNRHGTWSEEPVRLDIQVDPPPWATWWAFLIYAAVLLLGAGVIVYILRQRLHTFQTQGRLSAVERELELTGAVQEGFLPQRNNIQKPGFHVFGFHRPAESCSGDWWWYEEWQNHHIILVGDVTGHGAGPAMVTAAVATAFRVAWPKVQNIDECLQILNREVMRTGGGKYMMTLTVLVLEANTGQFQAYGAGGLPPFVLKGPGTRATVELCRGTPLGTANFEAGCVEGTLVPGSRVMLFTDGIHELTLPNGRLLGLRRFSRMYQKTSDRSLETAVSTIIGEADELRANSPQEDDWTFAIVEWNGPA